MTDPIAYSRLLQPYRRALARLRLDFQFFREESGPLLIISVEVRLKGFKSAVEKAQQLGIPVDQLDDLAGFRVVAGTSVDVGVIRHFFTNGLRGTRFTVAKEKRVKYKNGYRAHHIVLEIPESYTGTWSTCRVEIQLQTALESAFNKLSRLWIYKSGRHLPVEWEHRFSAMAAGLQAIDEEASELQQILFSTSESLCDDTPLTPLAYHALIKECFGESTDDDDAQWHSVYYRRCGVETCGQLRQFFLQPDVANLYEEWSDLTQTGGEDSIFAVDSKRQFWAMYGLRFEWAVEYLSKAKAKRELGK
jgi:ppGpp synthetase/RelA/SpoT-type nucleotidyltranferase